MFFERNNGSSQSDHLNELKEAVQGAKHQDDIIKLNTLSHKVQLEILQLKEKVRKGRFEIEIQKGKLETELMKLENKEFSFDLIEEKALGEIEDAKVGLDNELNSYRRKSKELYTRLVNLYSKVLKSPIHVSIDEYRKDSPPELSWGYGGEDFDLDDISIRNNP